jgi:hypothetical protein
MWRFVKAVFVSWLIGVICGGGLVLLLQHEGHVPPSITSSASPPSSTEGTARAP